MVSRGGGVAVFRCGTSGADTSTHEGSSAPLAQHVLRPTGNVAVSGLVVAQHVSTWRVERTFDRGEGRMEGSLEVTLEDP
jgi:hypothetical protein